MSEPRIYSKNYIDSECLITSSHGGDGTKIYDRNSLTIFSTSGANSDATIGNIQIYFQSAGISQARTIDTIVIKNYNFLGWTAYYYNGTNWIDVFSSVSDSQSNRVISFSPVSTTAIQIQFQTTKTPNQEKTIGELIACNTVIACDDMSSYDPKWRERSKEIVLGDGSVHKVYTKDASGRLGKYEASVRFNYLSKATRDSLKAIKDTGEPFLWQPESVTVPEDIYYVHWSNTWDEKYMSNFKSAGYEVIMNLKEV